MGVFGQNNILFWVKNASMAKNPLFFFMIIIINIINKKFYRKKVGFWPRAVFSVKGVTRKTSPFMIGIDEE
jgi:hypothetical protein